MFFCLVDPEELSLWVTIQPDIFFCNYSANAALNPVSSYICFTLAPY
jgi:hypothetical protein